MPFGVRKNPYDPTGPKILACPGCDETFPDTPKGRKDFKAHLRTHENAV